jgi:octaprenyl-diphosphate synthase
MDKHWHRNYASLPDLKEYYTMCSLKTGCLSRLAAVLGVYAVPAFGDTIRKTAADILGIAAEKLGVGFQILDDVKNLSTGNPGKQRGDDVVEGKKSLPVLLYLHRKPEQQNFVLRCFDAARAGGAGVPEVEELVGTLEKEGTLEEAALRGHELIREGREGLEAVRIPDTSLHEGSQRLLVEFAEFIIL